MLKRTPLTAALGVNAQVKCDCGYDSFQIGLAINPANGNNFIRVLQCTECDHQMAAVHQTDAQIAPSIAAMS